ncbi:RNA recognition motif domain-containing protein [Ditylenchus destructor]|nr:RNA recognition motif domain-containing protein [Ditylenchus destructor]
MSSGRIFIGGLSNRSTEHDIEDFFRGYGKILEVVLKKGFGFVQFEDKHDAEDAIKDLNGKKLCGERINLEVPNRDTRRVDNRGGSDRNYRSYDRSYGSFRGAPPPYRNSYRSIATAPHLSKHRLLVENLTTRYGWKELKELMSDCYPTFADAHKKEINLGLVCFGNREDLKRAIERFQDKNINGRRIKLIDDSASRSTSRSVSPTRRRRSRSHSKSRSPDDRRRSRSPPRKRARSVSHSPTPSKKGRSRSRTYSSKRSNSKSASMICFSRMGELFIPGLPHNADENNIKDFFHGYGKIDQIRLKKGFAFVVFNDRRDAEKAQQELNRESFLGRRVKVEFSKRDYGHERNNNNRESFCTRNDHCHCGFYDDNQDEISYWRTRESLWPSNSSDKSVPIIILPINKFAPTILSNSLQQAMSSCGERVYLDGPNLGSAYKGVNPSGWNREYNSYGNSYDERCDTAACDNSFRRYSNIKREYRYRLLVENLPSEYNNKDLKDLMIECSPLFTDAHTNQKHLGIVCFGKYDNLKQALEKHQGTSIYGHRIKLTDDSDMSDISYHRGPSFTRKRRFSSHSLEYSQPKRQCHGLVLPKGPESKRKMFGQANIQTAVQNSLGSRAKYTVWNTKYKSKYGK